MEFILPTQNAPIKEFRVGKLRLFPNKRVAIHKHNGDFYWDSMRVKAPENSWEILNEWVAFHTFIFDQLVSLNWYEGEDFDAGTLVDKDECAYLLDYTDISRQVYFPGIYPQPLNYIGLYKKYVSQSEEKKSLVVNYFNSFDSRSYYSLKRNVRDNSFWRIVILFSIIESVIGDIQKCPGKLNCAICEKEIELKHNIISAKEWIKKRLTEIIPEPKIVSEYLLVIWEIREKIRHGAVHSSRVPRVRHIEQEEGEVIYNWAKTSLEWKENSTAMLALELRVRHIARYLLLNAIFGLKMFPTLRPLRTIKIVSPRSDKSKPKLIID